MKYLLIFLIFLFPFSSFSQEAFYASGFLGLNKTHLKTGPEFKSSESSLNIELTFGFRFGVLFNNHFSAGIYWQRFSGSQSVLEYFADHWRERDVTLNNNMVEVTYYFDGADKNSFWISGLLGFTLLKLESSYGNRIPAGSSSFSIPRATIEYPLEEDETSYGVSLGYHWLVSPDISFDPQLTYIYIQYSGGTVQFSGFFNVTLWF